MSSEQDFCHNQVKSEYNRVVGSLIKAEDRGRYFPGGVLLSHPGIGLSSQPDGLFASYATFDSNRLQIIEGTNDELVELRGSTDMVLEIVSTSSVKKDNVTLRELYWQAGIPEYWLVDARRELRFDILRHAARGYTAVRKVDGWVKSKVFERCFRLTRFTDRRGLPNFTLEVRE